MRLSALWCRFLNSLFPKPVHPFNTQGDGMSYARWQYEKGLDTVKFFLPFTNPDEMFGGKTVLDIGCGAAGKTLFYAEHGVEKIYGLEVLEKYRGQAEDLAAQLGLSHLFEFVCADASKLPFPDNSTDTVIMNDAFEHVGNPEEVLKECLRVIKPGGRIFVNFPPYHHPFGAHLSDAIGIPWVHLLFSDKTLIEVYRDAVEKLPDGQERLDFRISRGDDGQEYFSYINKMTVRRASEIVKKMGLRTVYHSETALRPFLTPLTRLPVVKEAFVKMVTYIFEK